MKHSIKLIAAIGCGLLAFAGTAHAEGFYFTSAFTPTLSTSGQSSITGSGQTSQAAGTAPTSITIANLRGQSTNTSGTPDNFNINYTLTVALTERTGSVAGPQTLSQNFSGVLTGTLDQSSANISNSFNNPLSQLYSFSSGQTFLVTLDSYSPIGPPNAGGLGAISAVVTEVSSTPEPGSIALLAGLGLSASWMTYRRRRRA